MLKSILTSAIGLFAMNSVAMAVKALQRFLISAARCSVNQGEGFIPVSGPLALVAGDRVMVGKDSFAVVSYAECAVSLSQSTVVTVSDAAPCAAGQTAVKFEVVSPTADVPAYDPAVIAPVAFLVAGSLLLGTGAVAVTCAVACKKLLSDSDNPDVPASAEVLVQ